ncbi:MAG: CmcI family methyltransferase [Candidatus Limnocylindria bacterium]
MNRIIKALRHPRQAALYAMLGSRRYRELMADRAASDRLALVARQLEAAPDVVTKFHLLSYHSGALQQTYWLGVPIQKSPLDCWVYQELITELRPDLIVETGTDLGGSALFLASICDLLGSGRVVTIDVRDVSAVEHPRIVRLHGDSTSPPILDAVRGYADSARTVMVVLDAEHSADHVARELRAYREIVTVGSYLVVEDTNVNGHPVLPDHGPGPYEAVEAFLREDPRFSADRSREKFLLTYFPGGFLRRDRA